ncbi:hypothetical protein ACFPK6_08120 [Dokdonella soli]
MAIAAVSAARREIFVDLSITDLPQYASIEISDGFFARPRLFGLRAMGVLPTRTKAE